MEGLLAENFKVDLFSDFEWEIEEARSCGWYWKRGFLTPSLKCGWFCLSLGRIGGYFVTERKRC